MLAKFLSRQGLSARWVLVRNSRPNRNKSCCTSVAIVHPWWTNLLRFSGVPWIINSLSHWGRRRVSRHFSVDQAFVVYHQSSSTGTAPEAFMALAEPPTKRIRVPTIAIASPPLEVDSAQAPPVRRSRRVVAALVPLAAIAGVFAGLSSDTVEIPASADVVAAFAPSLATFDEAVLWDAYFTVKETAQAITVVPLVSAEADGRFLVADAREAQIRWYSPTGELVTSFGRRGRGPGEFASLSGAIRLGPNRLLATDMNGQLTTFTNEGKVVRTAQVPLTPLYGAAKLDDSTLVLMGRSRGDGQKYLLHFWDSERQVLRGSFFPEPAHSPEMNDAYRFTGFPHVAIQDGSIAAIFAIDQKIQIFDRNGNQVRSVPIPFRDFRPLTSPIPPSGSPEAFQRWIESFSVASRIYWLEDGSFLIQYFDKVGQEPQWRLLGMSGKGEPLFEGPSPKLLSILPRDLLLFDAPDQEEPNVWRFASVSSGSRR